MRDFDMNKTILTALTLSLLALGASTTASGKPVTRHKAASLVPSGKQWDQTVNMTADGFPVLGNPAAPVKLVEFISYTCSHCAEFSKKSKLPLNSALVRQGRVSLELRPFLRTPIDETPSLLALCGPQSKYFANSTALLAAQTTWFKPPADPNYTKRWATLESKPAEQRRMIADDLGLYKIMIARGYSSAELDTCLNDQAKLDMLTKQTEYAATTLNVIGTPSFMIDGKLQEIYGWPELRPRLVAALAAAKAASKM
jgi:protein-disulfide isomerase